MLQAQHGAALPPHVLHVKLQSVLVQGGQHTDYLLFQMLQLPLLQQQILQQMRQVLRLSAAPVAAYAWHRC
jgi:hypothetical protein